jgi:hypothetical protein
VLIELEKKRGRSMLTPDVLGTRLDAENSSQVVSFRHSLCTRLPTSSKPARRLLKSLATMSQLTIGRESSTTADVGDVATRPDRVS